MKVKLISLKENILTLKVILEFDPEVISKKIIVNNIEYDIRIKGTKTPTKEFILTYTLNNEIFKYKRVNYE